MWNWSEQTPVISISTKYIFFIVPKNQDLKKFLENLINPDIDLIEVGKCVFLCAKNFLISENNIMTLDLRSSIILKKLFSFYLPFRLILTMQGELKCI